MTQLGNSSIAGGRRPVRVVVIDDHEFFRTGVVAWLRRQEGIECCGEAGSLAVARDALRRTPADIVLLDLNLPDGDGMELIGEARTLQSGLRIIVLSQREEAVFAERAIRAGARAYLMKSEASEQLLEAIRAVMRGDTWLSRAGRAHADPLSTAARLRQQSALGELSGRELQVFALVGAGLAPRDIAARLGISAKTVEAHREHIRHKLGLKTAAMLSEMAQRWVQAGKV